MKKQETGKLGETIACNFLRRNGYNIIETNYRCREGEIDIVARQPDTLVFFEVRTKKSFFFGSPEESITKTKKEHLKAAAERYIQEHDNLPPQWRIDVIAIQVGWDGKLDRIEVIENAIEDIA